MSAGRIVVLGSLILDWPLQLPRSPEVGETLMVQSPGWYAGGKGLNQAVGLVRQGMVPVTVGQVGNDEPGHFLLDALRAAGLSDRFVAVHPSVRTGTAVPVLSPSGQYILHVGGANQVIDPDLCARAVAETGAIAYALLQGEVNADANLAMAYAVRKQGGQIVLDPAPVAGVTEELLRYAAILTPNAIELEFLAGHPVPSPEAARDALSGLFVRLPGLAVGIATLGPQGVVVMTRQEHYHLPARTTRELDATAAGDAFNACLVASLASGVALYRAARRAVIAGSLACEQLGAVPSLPYRDAVDAVDGRWDRLKGAEDYGDI